VMSLGKMKKPMAMRKESFTLARDRRGSVRRGGDQGEGEGDSDRQLY
jgi:hypothetical protein